MALTHVPARNEVDTRYTWNDTSVFATVDEWASELEALSGELDRLSAHQGHLADGPRALLDALRDREKFVQRAEKALIYAYLAQAVDTTDQAATERVGRGMGILGDAMSHTILPGVVAAYFLGWPPTPFRGRRTPMAS